MAEDNVTSISDTKLDKGSFTTQAMDLLRTQSTLISRLQLANRAGLQFGGLRDLYAVFGYNKALTADDLLAKYTRQDIASRIVDAPPSATWSHPPTMKDNDVVQAKWDVLTKKTKLWGAMYRADRLARLNAFSLLLIGFDDSGDLAQPVRPGSVKQLLYVRSIGARQVEEVEFDDNVRSPRFGMPNMYKVKFDDPTVKASTAGTIRTRGIKDFTVHWTRTVHVTENPLEDLVFGIPILEKVYNLLDDLLKVAGGTSEMYWLTGNRGLHASIDADMDVDPDDAADLADEIEEYQHQLRRFIKTRGVDLKVLESTTPNPKDVFEMIMALISGTTGIPRRILTGSEAGQLASEQDRANWAERITERRNLYATPDMLDPVVERLQHVNLLPEGDIEWEWPSAFIQNPLEESQVMAQTARAVGNLSRQTGNQKPMQVTSREEARNVLGLEDDLDESKLLNQEPEGNGSDDDPTGENVRTRIREEDADE